MLTIHNDHCLCSGVRLDLLEPSLQTLLGVQKDMCSNDYSIRSIFLGCPDLDPHNLLVVIKLP
jgi:hypothetical protein